MIRRAGLGRQILLSMAAVTVVAALVVFSGIYIAYALIMLFVPSLAEPDSWIPSGTDLLLLAFLIFLALLVAGFMSLKLAARLLVPLNSLAESARRIAEGDLSARAVPGDQSLGETAHLVTDFNVMAQRLQDMSADMAAWNAAIAHELRTPLTILKGNLRAIADGVFRPDEQLIRNMLLQVDGLSRLADDLRVVTLADGGRLDLHKEPIDLAEEIGAVVGLLGPALAEEGFHLETTLIVASIEADGARIRQAVLALIDNVRRHAKPGRIAVATLMLDGQAVIRIEDDGPGLPSDFVRSAFDPFTRGRAVRGGTGSGSGLGLSVVRAIAEAHGGAARYRPSSRGGSAFEIYLPLHRVG